LTIFGTFLLVSANLKGVEASEDDTLRRFPLLMPKVAPQKDDSYFCTTIRIDPTEEYYITGFTPNATSAVAHHMLLYGCGEPGAAELVWNCGAMASHNPQYGAAPVCQSGQQVVYAWAMDAPSLVLPEGVAFRVGRNSAISYLVLQVHYASVASFQDGSTDDSGIFIYYKKKPQPKSAGVLLLATGGRILPRSVEFMEVECAVEEDKVLHPFAFRTHTHALGRVVSGYKVSRVDHEDHWTLLGKKDPQLPQMFYPVETNTTLRMGDRVAARCTMVSERDRVTRVGATAEDEMCNYYVMYWVEGSAPLTTNQCVSFGPPFSSWSRSGLTGIPEEDASSLPLGQTAQEMGIASHTMMMG